MGERHQRGAVGRAFAFDALAQAQQNLLALGHQCRREVRILDHVGQELVGLQLRVGNRGAGSGHGASFQVNRHSTRAMFQAASAHARQTAARHPVAVFKVALGVHLLETGVFKQRADRRALVPAVFDQQPATGQQVRAGVGDPLAQPRLGGSRAADGGVARCSAEIGRAHV